MGKVYLAVHPGIGRQAAVKVLSAGLSSDEQIVSRFITEARAANAIRHPNLVDIYDSGVLEDGTPYIIMEYLEGETLTQALAQGPLSIDDAFDWSCQIAEALAAAHARDVVHRDLKPDNLFLIPDPRRLGKKQVKVLDFGIAKLQRRAMAQVHKTRTGALLGTPLYMSPEQCLSVKDIDARTDIYSLGVILYEMVAGKRPFDGEGVYAIINMHINEPPVPPSTYRQDLPRELETIILQAMAKAPAERQESMAVLLSRLELARGNPAASSEALARAHQEQLRPIPIVAAQPASIPEIKTLGDTAVSITRQTAGGRRPMRLWVPLGAALAVAGSVLFLWGPLGRKPPPPREAPAPESTSITTQSNVAAPPAAIEMGVESSPPGAEVLVDDVLVGVTPTRYSAKPGSGPTEFVFRLAGFGTEKLRALPAAGLTVTAKLSPLPTPSAAKAPPVGKRKRAVASPTEPSADIQTER